MSELKYYCSGCGAELVSNVSTSNNPCLFCPKCDITVWDKIERQKKLAREGIIVSTGELSFSATDCRDDYIEIHTESIYNCVNCGKKVGEIWIHEPEHLFCGFKCLIQYYLKELKKEGKL